MTQTQTTTEFDATFAAREARAAALEQSAGTPIAEALQQLQALRDSGEILLLADGTGTTKDHRGYERAVVAITQRLAATQVERIPEEATVAETDRLDHELAQKGGRLSDEQRAAIQLACSEHPLVVIEGHAGTGKSTTLTGIARAHQATGRHIIVTSTAALAAERLATELQEHGVDCAAYSTVGLHAAINNGRIELTADTTVIHDEAALASTREQLRLLRAVETSGARLIAVGDPRQNRPVGAGGLWDQIQHTTCDAGALVELTRNQRALDPADRHAQALFRAGQIEYAIRTYAARDRVHLHHDPRRVEDEALEAGQQDRADGKSTIVIAQTSNEHLDELNARAQAIRRQRGELSEKSLAIPGRPYELRSGDEAQIRHTIEHPEHGPLRNGTNATVISMDTDRRELELQLTDGRRLRLDQNQVEQADLRLAYVQHPFPAQGHTTDTAHVIVAGQVTREGTYVAITRARQQTDVYGALPEDPQTDRLAQLAEHVNHTEPEMPSISVPLAHEKHVTARAELEAAGQENSTSREPPEQELSNGLAIAATGSEEAPTRANTRAPAAAEDVEMRQLASARHELVEDAVVEPRNAAADHNQHHIDDRERTGARTWPHTIHASEPSREPGPERDRSPGWEM